MITTRFFFKNSRTVWSPDEFNKELADMIGTAGLQGFTKVYGDLSGGKVAFLSKTNGGGHGSVLLFEDVKKENVLNLLAGYLTGVSARVIDFDPKKKRVKIIKDGLAIGKKGEHIKTINKCLAIHGNEWQIELIEDPEKEEFPFAEADGRDYFANCAFRDEKAKLLDFIEELKKKER